MSDEAEKEYDQGYEDGYHNAAMTRVRAVDRLESQNQALQEALQRALERYDREDNGTLKVRDGLAWAMAQDLRDALSPTQETDSDGYVPGTWRHAVKWGKPTQETDPE